jgi:trimethylamine--corrinoid protein Co-methyltransferase
VGVGVRVLKSENPYKSDRSKQIKRRLPLDVNSRFTYWQRPKLQGFSEKQYEKIYLAALEVLERTGVKFYSQSAIELLKKAGVHEVDEMLVKIPSGLVERAVSTVGRRQTLSDRNGKRVIFLEEDNTYFGPGSDNPTTIDIESGERRQCILSDVVRAAIVVDALENIDFAMGFALASDVKKQNADLYHFEAIVNHTIKPVVFTAWDPNGLKAVYEICSLIRGGEAGFRQNPNIILYEQPSSPLKHSEHSTEKLMLAAEKGIPIIYAPTPAIGAASPVTLPGSFVVNMAEFLSALVLVQIVQPGSTLVFGGGPSTLDMRTAIYSYAAPETMLSLTMRKEAGAYLGLPTFNAGGFSDSKTVDQQAALEAANSILFAALAGGNLIHDVGYLEYGLTSSLELLAICDDEISLVKRYLRSCPVSTDTLAVDLIDEVGPDGDYLGTDHTVTRFREEVWEPDLIDRNIHQNWEAAGSTTLRDRAREKVKTILQEHKAESLDTDLKLAIRGIVEKYEPIRE